MSQISFEQVKNFVEKTMKYELYHSTVTSIMLSSQSFYARVCVYAW